MCGIVGMVEPEGQTVDRDRLARMCRTMEHRGPDGWGLHVDGAAGIAMQRLAIVDLARGDQPMTSKDCPRAGRELWIVFNGEIYNHAELRKELEALGHRWSTDHSDTEAILHAYEEWGDACVERLFGMFGFAIWDGRAKRLFVARDRLGIKPIYYWWRGGRFVFGTEIKAVLEHPAVERAIDDQAVIDYLGYEFVPGPRTMFAGIQKLQPGHTLTLERGEVTTRRYWDLKFAPAVDLSWDEAKRRILELLERSVRRRLMADVPLGVFLSGGVDSSSVVAMVAHLTGTPPKTFSIGYDDPSFSELDYAHKVAELYKTDHVDVMIRPVTSDDVERAVWHLDEPMTDLSTVPLFLLCQRARQDVKVCLSGEGGDEVFVGYDRFRASRATALYYARLPKAVRRLIEPLVARLPDQEQKKGPINVIKRFVDGARLDPRGEHMRWQHFLPPEMVESLFRRPFLDRVDRNAFRLVAEWADACPSKHRLDREVYVDLKMTMADSVLMKVDKMSMATGLEVRVPFLDHELVEFATSLPADWRLKGFETKSILKEAMLDHLPREILYRKKQGYSLPIKNWLREELRDYARSTIAESELVRETIEPAALDRIWGEHLSRRQNHNHVLWALLNLALWHRRFFVESGRAPQKAA